MASLLVQKHSSSYHCSSTSKHQFSVTILKIYLKYRRFFKYYYLHWYFYREIPFLPDLLLTGFLKSLDLIVKTKQTNIDRSDAKGLVSRHNAPNSAMNLSPFLCFLLHICCVYGVKAINLLYHNLGDLDFNGRRQAICARVWFGSFLTIICRRKKGVYTKWLTFSRRIFIKFYFQSVSHLYLFCFYVFLFVV